LKPEALSGCGGGRQRARARAADGVCNRHKSRRRLSRRRRAGAEPAARTPGHPRREIEQLLREYTNRSCARRPHATEIQVTIINDRSFNAFVVDAKRIFINAGALIDAKVPNESSHTGARNRPYCRRHLSRLRQQLAQAQVASIIAMILALAGAVAASRGGSNTGGNPAPPFSAAGILAAALVLPARAGGAG